MRAQNSTKTVDNASQSVKLLVFRFVGKGGAAVRLSMNTRYAVIHASFWGAYGSLWAFIALVLERAGSFLLGLWFEEGSVAYNAIMYFGIVAFSEEGAKYFLLRRRTWHSAAFNCQFDGVVYAVFVALGFALWENISYVLMYGLSTALVRAVTAVPGHACFGVFMGVWYGLAKRLHGQGKDGASKLCRVLALLLSAFLHGCYDYIATIESVHYGWLFAAFVAILFVLAFILVRRQARHDRYINNYDAEYL